MSKRSPTLASWEPTAKQAKMAEYLAVGYSRLKAARLAGVAHRTQERWWAECPEYRAYIAELQQRFVASQRALFDHTVALAQHIVHGALSGDFDADSPDVRLARAVLGDTLWKHVQPRQPVDDDLRPHPELPERSST